MSPGAFLLSILLLQTGTAPQTSIQNGATIEGIVTKLGTDDVIPRNCDLAIKVDGKFHLLIEACALMKTPELAFSSGLQLFSELSRRIGPHPHLEQRYTT